MNHSYGLDTVKIAFLSPDTVDGETLKCCRLPLVILPRWDTSLKYLCSFLEANRDWIEAKMLKHGAVLFRGFDIESCPDFELALKSLQPKLHNTYRGTSPRVTMEGTNYVFSAADVPVNYPIAQHIEMSFLPSPPRQIFLSCMEEPKSAGGETALCDFRKVYEDIPSDLREKLLTKKLLYTRTHKRIGSRFTCDVSDMLGWPQLFGTSDPSEVERACREEGTPVDWTGPNNDTFLSVFVSEPFQHHPVTKEPVWFNHAQVFHWTSMPVELCYAFFRTYELRLLIHCVVVSTFCIVKYGLLGHKMSLDVRFGDGTPITVWEMHQIRNAVHKHMVFNRWKRGDVLCIDNFSTSHGRQPTFDTGRKVVVAWAQPLMKSNKLTSSVSNVAQMKSLCTHDNPQE